MALDPKAAAKQILWITAQYPINYAHFSLMVKPLAPRKFSFMERLCFPCTVTVLRLKEIHSIDGTVGLFRGSFPSLLAHFSSTQAYRYANAFGLNVWPRRDLLEPNQSDNIKMVAAKLCLKSVQGMVPMSCAVIVSQPFFVVYVRMMAQFAGSKTAYCGFLASVQEIYNNDGILGFFAGIISRLAAESLSIVVINVLDQLVIRHLSKQIRNNPPIFRLHLKKVIKFIAGMIVYPFRLKNTLQAGKIESLVLARASLFKHWKMQLKLNSFMVFNSVLPLIFQL